MRVCVCVYVDAGAGNPRYPTWGGALPSYTHVHVCTHTHTYTHLNVCTQTTIILRGSRKDDLQIVGVAGTRTLKIIVHIILLHFPRKF